MVPVTARPRTVSPPARSPGRPADQTRATTCATLARPERLWHRINIRYQAIAHDSSGPHAAHCGHKRHQTPDQVTIPMGTDCPPNHSRVLTIIAIAIHSTPACV